MRAEDPGSDRPTIARRGHKTLAEFSPTFPVRKYTFHTECGAVDAVDPEDMVDLAGVGDTGDAVGRAEVVNALDAAEVEDVLDVLDVLDAAEVVDALDAAEVVDADAAEVVDVDTVKGSLGSIVVCSHIASDNTSFF